MTTARTVPGDAYNVQFPFNVSYSHFYPLKFVNILSHTMRTQFQIDNEIQHKIQSNLI